MIEMHMNYYPKNKSWIPVTLLILCLVTLLVSGCSWGGSDLPATGIVSGKLCFPSDYIPEMDLFFQSVEDDTFLSFPTFKDQKEYAFEVESGTYLVYAWLPGDIFLGGSYSAMVPCGLEVGCTDHSLLPVVVEAGSETTGVDVCDWYGHPGDVPLPLGKMERMIGDYLRESHPDLDDNYLPRLEEPTAMRELIAQRMSARFFRIIEDPFLNEMFLITHSGKVIQMGTAVGGKGVNSFVLADLDQDNREELYFSYSWGSGIRQSHIGMYAPAYSWDQIYEVQTYFLGDVKIFTSEDKGVIIRPVEGDEASPEIEYSIILGNLDLDQVNQQPSLVFEAEQNLSEELKSLIVTPQNQAGDESINSESENPWWIEINDSHHGVSYAVPCFWEVNFPDPAPPVDAIAYMIRNYSEQFSMSFGKNSQGVWDNGGIKIDMNFISTQRADWDLPEDPSLDDMIQVLFDENDRDQLISINDLLINNQPAKELTIRTFFDEIETQRYLLKVSPDLFLWFAYYPPETQHPDVMAILQSISLGPDVPVRMPGITPALSPEMDGLSCPPLDP